VILNLFERTIILRG